MQTDLDKTMDAILRRARETGFSESPAADAHLDADELSLFAENLSPPKARVRHVEHLANCRSCRNELAQLIQLNADAAEDAMPVSEAVAAPAVSDEVPWYRRLMLFPNLAYVMGSLVLVFGGLLVVSVYQSNRSAEISYSTADSAPARSAEVTANADASTGGGGGGVLEKSANITGTGNSAANMIVNPNTSRSRQEVASDEQETADVSLADPVAAQPAPPIEQPTARAYSNEARREEMAVDGASAPPPTTADGVLDRSDKKMAARSMERQVPMASAPEPKTNASNEKVVSGKRFIRRQNVWYDVRYTGGPTVNVRRGTADYGRIDAGVKRIAEQIPGTVVIVADDGKAYRISD